MNNARQLLRHLGCLIIDKGKWGQKINDNNQRPKHKTKNMQSLQIKIMQITTIPLKTVRKHVRKQHQTAGLSAHSPERRSDVNVVVLPKASQIEVAPA